MLEPIAYEESVAEKLDLQVEELEDAIAPSGWDWAIYGGAAVGGIALGFGAAILVGT